MNEFFQSAFSFEQVLGYIASAILLTGFAIKHDKKMKAILTLSSLLFAAHYYLIGAFAGMAISAVNAARNSSSIFFYQSRLILGIFLCAYIVSGVLTIETGIDILPFIAAISVCIGMFLLQGLRFRLVLIFTSLLWIIYTVFVGSIGGLINSAAMFFISINTAYRVYCDERRQK